MLGVKKLDIFILKSYLLPLLITFFVTTFLLLMQFLWRYIDDLVGKGLEMNVILELFFFAAMGILQMSLPLAVLCASIFAYGSMGDTNELIAIKSAGVSLSRIMRPLIIFNIFLMFGSFVYANNVLPYSNLRLWSLMFDVRNQRPEMNIKEGVFFDGIEQVRLKISSKNTETNMMYDMMIYDHRNNSGNTSVIIADSATMKVTDDKQALVLTLYSGESYEDVIDRRNPEVYRQSRPFRQYSFDKQQVLFELEDYAFNRTNMDLFKHNSQMQNVLQLDYMIDSLSLNYKEHNARSFKQYYINNVYKYRDENGNGTVITLDSLRKTFSNAEDLAVVMRAANVARTSESFLLAAVDSNIDQEKGLNKLRIEWHKKFTLGFACLIMFFVGAPFGALVKKGGFGIPVIFSFIFYLLYYVLTMIGEKSVKAASVSTWFGMWFPIVIIMIVGVYFTKLAMNDKELPSPVPFLKNISSKILAKKMKLNKK
ncbi:MAG: LptF/LptG family permease [Bacteroidales bacterium]|nr:LptF/LptG family permease [Bacteroidales bacterium]